VRADHGVAPLQWDNDLAALAQTWADNCQWAHNDSRSDTFPGYIGENIAGGGLLLNGQTVTDLWAAEEANYDYDNNSCSAVCGHYTQVVWAESLRMGCGYADCSGTAAGHFIVCNYSPGGNSGGRPY
jgi:uncharacterized protein YkwD